MADIPSWKIGDTYRPLEMVLRDESGPVDLTTAVSVYFVMETLKGVNVIDAACIVVDATAGEIKYEWAEDDTDIAAGIYNWEIVVTWPDGKEDTYPHRGKYQLQIAAEVTRAT